MHCCIFYRLPPLSSWPSHSLVIINVSVLQNFPQELIHATGQICSGRKSAAIWNQMVWKVGHRQLPSMQKNKIKSCQRIILNCYQRVYHWIYHYFCFAAQLIKNFECNKYSFNHISNKLPYHLSFMRFMHIDCSIGMFYCQRANKVQKDIVAFCRKKGRSVNVVSGFDGDWMESVFHRMVHRWTTIIRVSVKKTPLILHRQLWRQPPWLNCNRTITRVCFSSVGMPWSDWAIGSTVQLLRRYPGGPEA